MANVLNEFLHGVSKGFQDAAFASFSRRRSTVRDDIHQSFGAVSDDIGNGIGDDYNVNLLEESSSSNAPEGIVDVSLPDDAMTEI